MKKSIFFIFLPLLFSMPVMAQQGDFFLKHFSPEGEFDNVNFDIIQDHKGLICIANRAGIITFDGQHWNFSKTPSAIFSLSVAENNTIYAGGRDGFGKLIRDGENRFRYLPLSHSQKDAIDIGQTVVHNGKLYALNQRHVFVYDITRGDIYKITSRYSGRLTSLIAIGENIYVNTTTSGLQRIEGMRFAESNKILQNLSPKFVMAHPNRNDYLIGTYDNLLFSLNKSGLHPVELKNDAGYIGENGLKSGLWISDTLAALSTLKGGIVFIDPSGKKVTQIINYQTGLPDNEILAMTLDKNHSIWTAHRSGFSMISPALPFRSYNRYVGLEGKILTVQTHKNAIYVGTSLGAYLLREEYDYKEIIRKVTVEYSSHEKTEEKRSRKGLFSFLRRKTVSQNPTKEVDSVKTLFKTSRQLQAVRYVYEKINGINAKTSFFASAGDRLFCGGLDGLYEIKGAEAVPVADAPIRYLYASEAHQKIFVNTYDNELKVYDYAGSQCRETSIFGDYKDYVQCIFEDYKGRIWFCSINDLYWIKLEGNEIAAMDEYKLENPYFYKTYGVTSADSTFFLNEEGIFTLNEEKNELVKIKGSSGVNRYLQGGGGRIWINAQQRWSTLLSGQTPAGAGLLNLFRDISFISVEEDNFWVVTEKNDLYKLSFTARDHTLKSYDLYLASVRSHSSIINKNPPLIVDQQNSPLTFEFIQPEYSGVMDLKYQYKLAGLNEKWSEWSRENNKIVFPYLPEGNYSLLVRSKNVLGNIKQAQPVTFQVVPPFWKRPWFYAFEFSVLALLLFVSISLKKMGYKYRLASRLLALLVLIIVIEFIQTVAEYKFTTLSSPVIDFGIQVIIAIIILPVEGGLRKYIFKEREIKLQEIFRIKR